MERGNSTSGDKPSAPASPVQRNEVLRTCSAEDVATENKSGVTDTGYGGRVDLTSTPCRLPSSSSQYLTLGTGSEKMVPLQITPSHVQQANMSFPAPDHGQHSYPLDPYYTQTLPNPERTALYQIPPSHVQQANMSSPEPDHGRHFSPPNPCYSQALPCTERMVPPQITHFHVQRANLSSPELDHGRYFSPLNPYYGRALPSTERTVPPQITPSHVQQAKMSYPGPDHGRYISHLSPCYSQALTNTLRMARPQITPSHVQQATMSSPESDQGRYFSPLNPCYSQALPSTERTVPPQLTPSYVQQANMSSPEHNHGRYFTPVSPCYSQALLDNHPAGSGIIPNELGWSMFQSNRMPGFGRNLGAASASTDPHNQVQHSLNWPLFRGIGNPATMHNHGQHRGIGIEGPAYELQGQNRSEVVYFHARPRHSEQMNNENNLSLFRHETSVISAAVTGHTISRDPPGNHTQFSSGTAVQHSRDYYYGPDFDHNQVIRSLGRQNAPTQRFSASMENALTQGSGIPTPASHKRGAPESANPATNVMRQRTQTTLPSILPSALTLPSATAALPPAAHIILHRPLPQHLFTASSTLPMQGTASSESLPSSRCRPPFSDAVSSCLPLNFPIPSLPPINTGASSFTPMTPDGLSLTPMTPRAVPFLPPMTSRVASSLPPMGCLISSPPHVHHHVPSRYRLHCPVPSLPPVHRTVPALPNVGLSVSSVSQGTSSASLLRPESRGAVSVQPLTAIPLPKATAMVHVKWEGPDEAPEPMGRKCFICKRDLAFTPEGPVSLPTIPPAVAVLPCGHSFHDRCLEQITSQNEAQNPSCIPCALDNSGVDGDDVY